jgi:hypothetical protein
VTRPIDERRDALRHAAERLLRRQGAPHGPRRNETPWDADFFGLAHVAEFRRAAPSLQRATVADCATALLSEAWFIEKCGVAFCARMTLLSETDDERRVFALIGAEEAKHSAWLEPWIADGGAEADAFSAFIGGVAETGGAQALAYLLQVVLEGFGIVHYASLADGCRDDALGALLRRMAQDEALHHAAGLAAFRPSRLSVPERRFLSESAYSFLHMMRSGPQAVVAALERRLGIGTGRIAAVFSELDAQAVAASKLRHLLRLMKQPGMEWLVRELHDKGAFTPCTAAQCASIYAGVD